MTEEDYIKKINTLEGKLHFQSETLQKIARKELVAATCKDGKVKFAKVSKSAGKEIKRLRNALKSISDVTAVWKDSLVGQVHEMANEALEGSK